MLRRLLKRRITDFTGLFNGHFIDVKALYALEFDAVSCVAFIGEVDTGKAFAFVCENIGAEILSTYQHAYFDHHEQKMFFNNTIFVLTGRRMIELGSNYVQVLHTPGQYNWANGLIQTLSQFKIENSEPVIGFTRQTAGN